MSRGRASQGFSLIEVLITMFVVSVGLLGVAGLQTFSKKSNFDAVQRTTAAALAQDIIERMRANTKVLPQYLTAGISDANPVSQGTDCRATTCSPQQLATYDLFQWSQALQGAAEVAGDGTNAGGLSSATGCVTVVSTSSSACLFQVTIAWRGVTPLEGAAQTNTCGVNNLDYTDTNGKLYRRLVSVPVYIDPSTPC